MIENIQNAPMVQLLWTILSNITKTKSNKRVDQVKSKDVFTILAAILDIQVNQTVNDKPQEKLEETANPLIYRNK